MNKTNEWMTDSSVLFCNITLNGIVSNRLIIIDTENISFIIAVLGNVGKFNKTI